ncbi:right-handed parallel beta-helix repeat-containing protein [Microbacterium nanhaiense]|uniref:right-handed parallel beta-helix repeat-containing protein n=1 Tax=Microbacterium nanhaiense TaxID=1301026 RepID=UPI001669F864|nr:right-handed parallel beta-helix repeat-containing protein [Microbacterium nanhaiense]
MISVSTTEGGNRAIGAFTASRLASNDIKILRWTVASGGQYALQRGNGPNLAAMSWRVLTQSSVFARANDLVDLEYLKRDGLLVLRVNGAVAAVGALTSAERPSHDTGATIAGVWGNGNNLTSNKLGGWQWLVPVSTGTVTRRMVSVDSTLTMPADVKLNPAQKRQAVGPVFDIRDYGAKCDGVYVTDARTQAGANYVWTNSYNFTSADIGKRIAVKGAGPVIANANDGVWLATITAIDGTAARVDSNATSTVTGARCVFGTPDDVAIAQAQKEAVRAGGGTVRFPAARTIATVPLNVENYVSWAGIDRNVSWVHVLQDNPGNGGVAGTSDWLTCAGRTTDNPLIGATFRDFGVNAEFHVHSAGYGTAVKPLNIYLVQRCSIERMNVWNTPATAVPFDHSYDQVTIGYNFILNPGRLAPSGVGPGGSGIGAGTKATGATEPTLIIGNVIRGMHSAAVAGPGHNGIFTEAQSGADPDAGVPGYRIVNNVVEGMPNGISDTGSTGTIISGNEIIGCGNGIRLAKTTLPDAYPGLHANILGNTIRGCTGPGETDGVGILIAMPSGGGPNLRDYLHTLITGNQIFECKSWGVSVENPAGSSVEITGIVVQGNVIRACGRSGVRLYSGSGRKLRQIAVRDNQLVGNGRRGISDDRAGVLVWSGATLEGGRIQDNDIYDLASNPTQVDTIVTTGATLTGARISGNTGDA